MSTDDVGGDWRELALLWAARRSGALDALATTAGTPSDLAAATDVEPAAAERLLAALEAVGMLTRVGDEYEPTDRMLGVLTTTDLRSIGTTPADLDAFDRWVNLPETLTGAAPPDQPDALRNDLGRRTALDDARCRAEVTTAVHAAPTGDRVLVIGDGAGVRAREFAARGWSVTLQDAPERIDAVRPLLRSTPIDLRASEPTDAPDCDLVVGCEVLSRHDSERARAVVEAAGEAAPVGVFLDAFHGATPDAELRDVGALAAGSGRVHTTGDVSGWLETVFGAGAVESVPASPLSAAVGRAID